MNHAPYPRFHLAVTVSDLDAARRFYGGLLGCRQGRESPHWIDFDFFGHQLTVHLGEPATSAGTSEVDGHPVPAMHFGPVLPWDQWQALVRRLREAGVAWVMAPTVRFAGQAAEQGTMFIRDPSGNNLEFKSFRDESTVFSSTTEPADGSAPAAH